MIRIPIVAGKFLVVPDELAGCDVERHCRVAVKIGWRAQRNCVGAAVTCKPRVGIRVCDAPVEHFAFRIVGAGQPPWACRALVDRHIGPRVAAGLARRGGDVELPYLFARFSIVSGDKAILALILLAGPVRDHLAVSNQQTAGGLAAIIDLGFPAHLSGFGVERHQVTVGRSEIDHVLVDTKALVTRCRRRNALRIVALIFPNQIAVRGIDRLDAGAGHVKVHDAAINDRCRFLRAVRQPARPGHPQLADVVFIDLVERTEALLIEGAADHQPVGRIRIDQRFLGDRLEIRHLRGNLRYKNGESRRSDGKRKPHHDDLPNFFDHRRFCGRRRPE